MKIVDIRALLSEISNHNNLGTIAFRDGTMNHRRDGSCLLAFDRAIADFSVAVSAVRAGLHSISSGGSDHDDNNNSSINMPSCYSTSAQSARKKRKQAARGDHCVSQSAARTTKANKFSAHSLPKQKPQLHGTRTKALVQQPTLQSPPPTIEQQASNQSLDSTGLFEQGQQQERLPLNSLFHLRNAILNDVDKNNHDYLPCESIQSEEVAFVYEGPIIIDPLELRKWLAHVVKSSTLPARQEMDEVSSDQQERPGSVVGLLRDFLFRMSITIVYNLGLAYHLKSTRERVEFQQSSTSAAQPPLNSSCSTSFLTSLQKAQVFYSMASRHITHLPSWKFKLALLNNLGLVYWERNLGDNARPCFEAVCRHILKVAYQCSHRSILIPSFSSFAEEGGAICHIPHDQGTEELLQAFMIAALMKLLSKPHAAVA